MEEGIERIYTTINPNNESSIKLHEAGGFQVKNWKIALKGLLNDNLAGSN